MLRGNCWWRLVEAELRTKRVNFDEFCAHFFADITNGERPPVDEDEETVQSRHLRNEEPTRRVVVESLEKPRFLVKIPTICAVKNREW